MTEAPITLKLGPVNTVELARKIKHAVIHAANEVSFVPISQRQKNGDFKLTADTIIFYKTENYNKFSAALLRRLCDEGITNPQITNNMLIANTGN